MFATLDPTLRAVTLPSRRQVLLSDTVGFIRNLPHTLVSAFRATLEEVQRAALLLHVSDATSPVAHEQMVQVEAVLRELEVGDKKQIQVVNKIDLVPPTERGKFRDDDKSVHVSAIKGTGLDALLHAIDEAIQEDPVRHVKLSVPVSDGKALSLLEARAQILGREYKNEDVLIDLHAPESVLRKVKQYVIWQAEVENS
jgi:GTP-binding protein HflX